MTSLDLLRQNGLPLVLSTIAASQAGAPAPSATLLMLAAAFARDLHFSPWSLFLWVTVTVALVDHLWFWLGRTKGVQLLGWIERLSPASKAAVEAVRRLNRRHGVLLLVVSKFLPGVHTLVVPAAAAMRLSYGRFVVFSTLGTALWAGVYIGVGVALGPVVQQLAALAASSAHCVGLLVLLAIMGFAVFKIAKAVGAAHSKAPTEAGIFGPSEAVHS